MTKDQLMLSYMQSIELLSGGEYRAPHNFVFIGSDEDADDFVEELAMLLITVTVHTAHGRCWDCGRGPDEQGDIRHAHSCRSVIDIDFESDDSRLRALLNWAEERFNEHCNECGEPGHRPHCSRGLAWGAVINEIRNSLDKEVSTWMTK